MFTINLGPFSGKNAPEIHYHPSIADRILEGTAALCLLSGIGIVCWNYFHTDLLSDYGVYGIFISIVVFALLFGGAYAPVRCINFPVRPAQRPYRKILSKPAPAASTNKGRYRHPGTKRGLAKETVKATGFLIGK